MGTVVYLLNVSLDGFIEGRDHDLSWSTSDDELLAWFGEQADRAAALVYGRRLYETMAAYWPGALRDPPPTAAGREYARIWNAQTKVVFSSTLDSVIANSRLVRGDIVDELPSLLAEFDGELHVAGPTLASALVRRNLVDEYRLVVHPVIVGAGTPYFPAMETRIPLRLSDERTFASGVRYLAYSAR